MRQARIYLMALILLTAATMAAQSNATAAPIDTDRSQLLVRAFKSGLFSGFAHDHEIAAPIAGGSIDPQNRRVEFHVDVNQMKVLDPKLEADKRAEVQSTMLSDKVLDPARFPRISFVSRSVEVQPDGNYQVHGDLTLHGTTLPVTIAVRRLGDVYTGKTKLKQTDFGITPVKVLGGTVKVKDVVEISFEVTPRAASASGN